MSRESRKRALEEISDRLTRCTDADKDLPFLSNAPLMAVVELVQVLDEAGLLVDPDVADLDPDAPIPYTVSTPASADDEVRKAPCSVCTGPINIDGGCRDISCTNSRF